MTYILPGLRKSVELQGEDQASEVRDDKVTFLLTGHGCNGEVFGVGVCAFVRVCFIKASDELVSYISCCMEYFADFDAA